MAHEHASGESCLYCAIKHLGSAKVKMGEALASADPDRRKQRLLDAMAEMNEAETTHLSQDYPEVSKEIRGVRKQVEEVAFDFSKHNIGPSDLNPIIDHLLELEKEEHKKPSTPGSRERQAAHSEDDFTPDEYFDRVRPPSPENVLKAIDHYKGDYGAAASLSDVQFLLSIPHKSGLDRQIDRAFAKVPMPRIEASVNDLQDKGLIYQAPGGGYLLSDEGRRRLGFAGSGQGFNIPEASKRLKMLKGSDVGLIVGSELAGKGTELLASWADSTYGLSSQPLHMRVSTYVPIIGLVAVLAAAYTKMGKKKAETQLALAAYGAHLLSQGVDVVQQATTPGVTFGLVATPRAISPGLSPAPTPGYIVGQVGGIGASRSIF